MKILVCVKQVPDSESFLSLDAGGSWIRTEGLAFRMNRFDEFAVEEALLIRESLPSSTIDAVTVGPPRAEAAVRRAMEMGADNGIHIAIGKDEYRAPLETASLISAYAQRGGYDLVLAGAMSEDGMHAQVGPMTGAMLGLPCVTSVMLVQISPDSASVSVEREIEGGLRDRYEVAMPAVLCLQSGINLPRYPSLSNVLRAKRAEIVTINEKDLASPGKREKSHRLHFPEKIKRGRPLRGSGVEKARELVAILRERSLL
jgi:electron transfer flavoprotein beta subunit